MNETAQLAARTAALEFDQIPANAIEVAKQAIMDFIGVTIAGMEEPLAKILREDAIEQGGNPQATIIATGERTSITQAALINGSAGHAHDYDDVQMVMSGHPTVPVAPVVLALAEQRHLSGQQLLTAFAAGVDAECLASRYAGESHYQRGWHSTGTLGTFGAAAAASNILGLDASATATAFGIAGTSASGLKANFGTMCKPLHAGHAAATGLRAATLAAKGFTSRDNILEIEQGFADTQSDAPNAEKFAAGIDQASYVQDICFKYHAACYLTHSAIEATQSLCASNAFDPNNISKVTVQVDKGHFRVCNILEPQSGLEAKFSLRFTVAMTLAGVDTSSIDIFTDELTQDPAITRFRDKVEVVAHENPNAQTIVTIETIDGDQHVESYNVAIPARDIDGQWEKLERKFRALVNPRFGSQRANELIDTCRTLEQQDDLAPLFTSLVS